MTKIKRTGWMLFATVLLCSSVLPARAAAPFAPRDPCVRWTLYEMAEYATGAPREVLEGLHHAESSKGRNTRHPNPDDVGEFGINIRYQAARNRVFGVLDPRIPHDAAIEAGLIYMDYLRSTDDETTAIAAYNQGLSGVARNGINTKYVAMVRHGMPKRGVKR